MRVTYLVLYCGAASDDCVTQSVLAAEVDVH